jgi:hypothetical protein
MYILKSQTLPLYCSQSRRFDQHDEPSSEVGAVLYIAQLFYCNHLSRSSLYEISTSASLRELQSAIRVTTRFPQKEILTLFTTDADRTEYFIRYCCYVPYGSVRLRLSWFDFQGAMAFHSATANHGGEISLRTSVHHSTIDTHMASRTCRQRRVAPCCALCPLPTMDEAASKV